MADNKTPPTTPFDTGNLLVKTVKRFKALSFAEYVALPQRQQCFIMSDKNILFLVNKCIAETDGSFTLEIALNEGRPETVKVERDTTILQVIG